MGFFAQLKKTFGRSPVPEADPQSHTFSRAWIPTDLQLTTSQMMTLSGVFACVRIIAEHIASSPVRLISRDGAGRRTFYRDSPDAYLLNSRPNLDITAQAFWEGMIAQALIYGNAYAAIAFDGAGKIAGLYPTLSRETECLRDHETKQIYYRVASKTIIAAEHMIHIRGPVIEGLLGTSIVSQAARAISTAYAAESFAQDFFANGAVPAGVLIQKEGRNLTKDASERLRDDWQAMQGGRNAHKTAVLPAGVDYRTLSVGSKDSQLPEARTYSLEDIARFFGVPLVLLGVQAAAQGYGTNVSQLGLQFARAGLTPWARRCDQEISHKLYGQWGDKRQIEHDLSWITLGSWYEQSQAVEVQVRAGVATIDEGRELLGRDPLPRGAAPMPSKGTQDENAF